MDTDIQENIKEHILRMEETLEKQSFDHMQISAQSVVEAVDDQLKKV